VARFRIRVLTAKLQQFKRAIVSLMQDFRPVWAEQSPIVRAEMIQQYKTQNYSTWRQITKATKKWRRRRGYDPNSPPLIASGSMLKAIQGGPGAIELQQQKALVMGVNLNQAAPNQFGANVKVRRKSDKQKQSGRGRRSKKVLYSFTIPPRPFIPDGSNEAFASKLSRQMESFMDRYLVKKLADKPKESDS